MYLTMVLFAGTLMVFTPLMKNAWSFINVGSIRSQDWIMPFKVEYV